MESGRDEYEEVKYAPDGRMLTMDQLDQLEGVDGVDQLDEQLDAFANVGQGLDGEHRTAMLNYWQQAIDEIEHIAEDGNGHECFKSTALPLARIKKVMKTDSEVRMISAEAPILFAKGCDIFITELTMRAWIHAEENKRRTLQRSDIATAIQKSDIFDFLIDIVPREEAQPRKSASHHRVPHGDGMNSPHDPRGMHQVSGQQPREMHYVGDSRAMTLGAPGGASPMNMNIGSVAVPSGMQSIPGAPPPMQNIPGSMLTDGGMPAQPYAAFDARYASQYPQQYTPNTAPPQPLQQAPQFGQYSQFGSGQYMQQMPGNVPPGSMSASPHNVTGEPPRPTSLQEQQPQQDVEQQTITQRAVPQQQQQQQQQPHGAPPMQNQDRGIDSPANEARSQASSRAGGEAVAQQEAIDQSPPPHESQQRLPQQPQSPGASPHINQKARDQPRYDSEFQYASYGDPVDVTFGQSY